MSENKKKRFPKTQHKKIYDKGGLTENNFVILDNPDDRITKKTGDGITLVTNDNPDDVEST